MKAVVMGDNSKSGRFSVGWMCKPDACGLPDCSPKVFANCPPKNLKSALPTSLKEKRERDPPSSNAHQ